MRSSSRSLNSSDSVARKQTTLNGAGRGPFEIGGAVDPPGEQPREADVLGEPRADALGAEVAQHHPQLERAKAAAELNAGVHQVLAPRSPPAS